MTTGKTIALTRRTFVDKVMSLLFNMLSRLVITFLPRSKRLLISWLQLPSAVILEPRNIKSATVSPSICHELIASLVAQRLKRLPAMRETWVWFLGQENPLEKEMATHSRILSWRSHGRRSLVGYSPRGRKESDVTSLPLFTKKETGCRTNNVYDSFITLYL